MSRWELTAPESHVLYYRGGAAPAELIRLAVAELVTRGIFRVEAVEPDRRRRQREPRGALVDGPAARRSVEPPLDVVLELIRETPRRSLRVRREGSTMAEPAEGVRVKDLRRVVRKSFPHLDEYRELHVAPLLVERGLLELTRPRRRSRPAEFDWTAAGREADAELNRLLALGREHLAAWAASDRRRAAEFMREAGSAVLLLRDQYPALEELSGGHGGGLFATPGADGFAFGDAGGLDLGDLGGGGGGGNGGGG